MGKDATMRASAESFLDAALRGTLTEADARRLYGLGPEAVTLVLLATARRVAELEATGSHASTPDPATPSGQVPVYAKPAATK